MFAAFQRALIWLKCLYFAFGFRLKHFLCSLFLLQLLEADVVGSTPGGLDVLLHPSGAPAFLPVTHLSDHLSNCEALLSVYKPSTRLTNVVYYGKSKDKSIVSYLVRKTQETLVTHVY